MKWQLEPNVSVAETDDGMVLLDERAGRYFQLNSTGVHVLGVLLAGGTAEAAVASLRERHPEAADRIPRDVAAVVSALCKSGMVSR